MALDLSSPPASPGLTSQVATLTEQLGEFVADLVPDTLLGADAASLYADVARMERLVAAAKLLLAPWIAASGHWETAGHRSPASLLADIEGVSASQAKRTLVTGQRLTSLPSMEEAVRQGRLSGPKVAELTEAATLDPRAEAQLLAGSEDESLQATKERCLRFKATSPAEDPLATAQRIHARRSFAHWTDRDGTFCYRGTDTPERGAALLARIIPVARRLRSARRASTPDARHAPTDAPTDTSTDTPPESEAALRADAIFLLVTGGSGAGGSETGERETGERTAGERTAGGSEPDSRTQRSDSDSNSNSDPDPDPDPDTILSTANDLIDRSTPATVMVRVDLDALLRGHAEPGELCELDGMGPISVPLAKALATDSFLSVIFTQAGDIRAVSHQGRTINRRLRTALAFRDKTCVVPRCNMPYGLEIDHIHDWALGGPTELANLALLCTHHHRKKTYEGWTLERNGPSDEDPQWTFAPLPPFGQEPDLGLDRKPEPLPRK